MLSISRSRLLVSSLQRSRFVACRRTLSTPPPPGKKTPPPPPPTKAGVGPASQDGTANRGPVSWMSLFLVGVAAASVTAYYKLERERRMEQAMRKVVSSESDGWSPNPEVLAKRKFKRTPWGWFPEEDAFGAGELVHIPIQNKYKYYASCWLVVGSFVWFWFGLDWNNCRSSL